MNKNIKNLISQKNPKALFAEGFDAALVGSYVKENGEVVAQYNYDKCLEVLMETDNINYEEAIEYMEYNVVSCYVGNHTPVFLT